MVGSTGLPVDDVRLIRPALVHAVAAARAGLAAEPPVQPPDGLRRVLSFRRLQTAALETVRRVLDSDEDFRQRVIDEVSEEELGRLPWVWLTRPEGWSEELADLVGAARKHDEDNLGERDVARLRRALAGAEEAARRHEAAAKQAREASRLARAELTEVRGLRRESERAVTAARAEAKRSAEERDQLREQQRETTSELEQVRRDLEVARRALHEAESELALERGRAGQGPAVGDDSQSGSGGAQVPGGVQGSGEPPIDLHALGARLQAAANTAAALSEALADAASDLPPGSAPVESGVPAARRGRTSRPQGTSRRARGRRPATMPPGVWDDAPEAAAHLVRLPGAVVLVDGYNVARTAWPSLTPEEERLRLIAALEELHARTGAEVTVVFDGVQEGGAMSGQASRTVRVRFTAEGVSADDVVRDMVDRFPLQRPVVVVSSDREVADGARARGANAVSSRQFLTALGR